jgi:amino acid transporter
MIVVSKEDQTAPKTDVPLQFFVNTLGQHVGTRVLAAFMAISSLGHIILLTFTAARVKQEIAREGILPYRNFFVQSVDLIAVIREHVLRRGPSKTNGDNHTPAAALLLHWSFTMILIFATWGISPNLASSWLLNVYSYTIDAFFLFLVAVGLLILRLRPSSSDEDESWRQKSSMPHFPSIASALVLAVAMGVILVTGLLPPSALTSGSAFDRATLNMLASGYPWFSVPTAAWALLAAGLLYWVCYLIVSRYGQREMVLEKQPFFVEQDGEFMQVAEITRLNWVAKLPVEKEKG